MEVRFYPQISNKICDYSECVVSPGEKNKLSTKLHTIWSQVLDRSAEVLNKLLIPLSILHTFFTIAVARWQSPMSRCMLATDQLEKFRRPLGRRVAISCTHH